jgi:hypothetical protein
MNPALYRCTLPRELLNFYELIYNNCIICNLTGLSRGFGGEINLFLGNFFMVDKLEMHRLSDRARGERREGERI